MGNGVFGTTSVPNSSGVSGVNTNGGVGVAGDSHEPGGIGVVGRGARAGRFEGQVEITGHVSAPSLGSPTGPIMITNGFLAVQGGAANSGHFFGPVRVDGEIDVSGDVRLLGADCAEYFAVTNGDEPTPGSVLVIGTDGALRESDQPYDKRVVGVVSGAGAYKPGIVLDNQSEPGARRPIALVGKAFCKVDAQYGSIEIGDLLTTSPTRGHAMKASDLRAAFGSVIGKSLRSLREGKDLIPILIALQ